MSECCGSYRRSSRPCSRSLEARKPYLDGSENGRSTKSQEEGRELQESHNASQDNTVGNKGIEGKERAEQYGVVLFQVLDVQDGERWLGVSSKSAKLRRQLNS